MNIFIVTKVTGILMPFAWIMGIILNAIYEFVGLFGIHNIALCIFIFTFVMKMLMLPLTIKQQKFTRLSSKMNPELTKIQEKYKGKKDEDSLRRSQAETQEVYAKYGTSPMGGCLPLLITLPIMFALYKVIYAIPAYVTEVGSLYGTVADAFTRISGHADIITDFIAANKISAANNLATFAQGSPEYRNSLIDILVKFSTSDWNMIFENTAFAGLQSSLSPVIADILSVNNLFGLSIIDLPKWNSISVIIPILAVVTQFIQGKMQGTGNDNKNTKADENNPMASSAKMMTTVMPIMSGVFCLMMPIGVGVYWIASALFTILQTIFINKYLEKADIDQMIEKNVEKANKRKAKLGVDYGNKMAEVAKTTTKTYDTSYDSTSYKKNNKRKSGSGVDYKRSNVSYKASSIAANANLLAAKESGDSDNTNESVQAPSEASEDQK